MEWTRGDAIRFGVGLVLVFAASVFYAFARGAQWGQERYLMAQNDAWYYQDIAERCVEQQGRLEEQAARAVYQLMLNARAMRDATAMVPESSQLLDW